MQCNSSSSSGSSILQLQECKRTIRRWEEEHTRRAPTKITRNKIRYHTVDSLVPERPADSTAQPNRTQPEPDPTLKNDQVIPETKFPA